MARIVQAVGFVKDQSCGHGVTVRNPAAFQRSGKECLFAHNFFSTEDVVVVLSKSVRLIANGLAEPQAMIVTR